MSAKKIVIGVAAATAAFALFAPTASAAPQIVGKSAGYSSTPFVNDIAWALVDGNDKDIKTVVSYLSTGKGSLADVLAAGDSLASRYGIDKARLVDLYANYKSGSDANAKTLVDFIKNGGDKDKAVAAAAEVAKGLVATPAPVSSVLSYDLTPVLSFGANAVLNPAQRALLASAPKGAKVQVKVSTRDSLARKRAVLDRAEGIAKALDGVVSVVKVNSGSLISVHAPIK